VGQPILAAAGFQPALFTGEHTLPGKQPQQVADEYNHQYCPQPYTRPAAGAPSAMSVISATAAKNQQQNNNQYQHFSFFLSSKSSAYLRPEYLFNLDHFLLDLYRRVFRRVGTNQAS
jgi:hypothetical protein